MSVADRLEANEQFQEAEEAYEKAMQADPTWGFQHINRHATTNSGTNMTARNYSSPRRWNLDSMIFRRHSQMMN